MNASRRIPTRRSDRRPARGRFRRGSVLIVVLVVVVLLTYGVYGFTERMLAEAEAANAHGRAVQATALAESGVELAASLVATRAADPENPVSLYHQPGLCGGIVLLPSATPGSVGRFSLVAPVEADNTYRQVRFGLADESGKLNVNAVAMLELEEFDQQTMLMYLPGMTEEIADAILDYIDEDDEIRAYGAESEYYETLAAPAPAKNGPLESLDELLLVRGVTPELLYGEDANRNGLLDPSEDDGPATPPLDDGDGVLNVGWAAYLTIHSRESNLKPDGEKKIHINQALLKELYTAAAEVLDEEKAEFIAAYRAFGPNDPDPEPESLGTSSPGTSSTAPDPSKVLPLITSPPDGDVTVGPNQIDVSKGAQFDIRSFYELVDRTVDVPGNEEKETQGFPLPSPWTTATLVEDLPVLIELFALTDTEAVKGRVNVNEARREVLLGLPNMTPQLADAIISARASGAGPVALDPERQTTAWLVARGIVDAPTMRKLDPYLTARGDVFKVQSVGFFDGGGPAARVEAVIDGTVSPAKVVSFRDLSDLGRGYLPSQLLPGGGASSP